MSIKSTASKIFASIVAKKIQGWSQHPVETQEAVFDSLIEKANDTSFGKDHNFPQIFSYADFKKHVPIRDYEELKPYIDRVREGEKDVLWPGQPLYFAKTSGTTSGAKYIPLTKESMPYHVTAARNALLSYIHETGKADFVNGKMIFLQGSPEVETENGIKTGRLSGIVAHYVPSYLQKNRLPKWETNCIDDWETKVDAIVEETKAENMTLISGIPSWVQMYFEKLQQQTDQKVGDLFKNFNLFVYGGVNYEPYRSKFQTMIGRKVDSIELYPASEGFFAYQDKQNEKGMLLLLDGGIFYEFVETSKFFDEDRKRISIIDVKLDTDYVMIVSTNAGLWAYNLGDTVQFTSLKPYRIIVSGRIKHFTSAFGEHVIGTEVETAMSLAMEKFDFSISEFTVAPQISPEQIELPYHDWLVEFEKSPKDLSEVEDFLDKMMQKQNSYYFDLIEGKVLQPLRIRSLEKDSFNRYMKSQGKFGGQNKVPRLANDRTIADGLIGIQATK